MSDHKREWLPSRVNTSTLTATLRLPARRNVFFVPPCRSSFWLGWQMSAPAVGLYSWLRLLKVTAHIQEHFTVGQKDIISFLCLGQCVVRQSEKRTLPWPKQATVWLHPQTKLQLNLQLRDRKTLSQDLKLFNCRKGKPCPTRSWRT